MNFNFFKKVKLEEIPLKKQTNLFLESKLDAFNNFGNMGEYNPVERPSFTGVISGIDKDGIVRINRYDFNNRYDGCCEVHFSKVRLK